MIYLVGLLAVSEVFIFARVNRATFEFPYGNTTQLMREFRLNHPGDYRVMQLGRNDNKLILSGLEAIGGQEATQNRRYTEFMYFTQGLDPEQIDMLPFIPRRAHPLYQMLRCRYAFVFEGSRMKCYGLEGAMPRLNLIQDFVILPQRDQIFTAMTRPGFDPRNKVILETPPVPAPVKSDDQGTASVIECSTDYLVLEADLPHPAILLITDAYSRGWRAVPLSGSVQSNYEVMPANYVLRAIPLASGQHRLRLEYSPLAFRIGKWISMVSVTVYLGVLAFFLWRWRSVVKRRPVEEMTTAQEV